VPGWYNEAIVPGKGRELVGDLDHLWHHDVGVDAGDLITRLVRASEWADMSRP